MDENKTHKKKHIIVILILAIIFVSATVVGIYFNSKNKEAPEEKEVVCDRLTILKFDLKNNSNELNELNYMLETTNNKINLTKEEVDNFSIKSKQAFLFYIDCAISYNETLKTIGR